MKNLPKLRDAVNKQAKTKLVPHILVGVSTGLIAGIALYFTFDLGVNTYTFIGGISVTMAIFATLMSGHMDHESNLHSEYCEMLTDYDLKELKQLSQSPELNDTERSLVIKYLNKNHMGWSLTNCSETHSA